MYSIKDTDFKTIIQQEPRIHVDDTSLHMPFSLNFTVHLRFALSFPKFLCREGAILVFNRNHFVCPFVGDLNSLGVFMRDIMPDIQNFRLLPLSRNGASGVPVIELAK
jgi:hypothetical protein